MINSKRIHLVNILMLLLPSASLQSFKRRLYIWAGVEVGHGVELFTGIKIYGNGRLSIGDKVFIGQNTTFMIDKNSSITLGNSSVISANVTIITGFHPITPYGERIVSREGTNSHIKIENGAAVLTGSTILPGVTIGTNSLIAAGAVVNKNVKARTLVGGVPAKFIKSLDK